MHIPPHPILILIRVPRAKMGFVQHTYYRIPRSEHSAWHIKGAQQTGGRIEGRKKGQSRRKKIRKERKKRGEISAKVNSSIITL